MCAGEWLTVVANTNCHTFEVAPVFTLVETEVLAKLARVIGGPYGIAHDGLFVPGGSTANIYGMRFAPQQHQRVSVAWEVWK